MKSVLNTVLAYVAKNPTRVEGYGATVAVAVAAALGIVVPKESVLHVIELVVPFVIAVERIRAKVTPVK